ncbi:MAG: hypothetical protein OQJ93_05865 [Ignavibacteriaceae bacterium]|nr:hypothetical protein [Ignavibacteriaceae bacterium]MCW9096897.1 hypothetical protein [Ignavibacteriaceae bacterium]
MPLVRFEGSKTYSPLLFFFKYDLRYILNTILAMKIIKVITSKMIVVSRETGIVRMSIKKTNTITIVE